MKEPKPKPCANKNCNKQFKQFNSLVKVCSTQCAIDKAKADREAKEAKDWNIEKRQRKEKLETVQDLMKKAQPIFNLYIRLRDKHQPCISCGKELKKGNIDCGHYWSSGGHKYLTFHEDNCHAQCSRPCNKDKAGDLLNYQIGIIKRIGQKKVDWLEQNRHNEYKPTREELRHLINFYKQKVKDLKD